MSDSWGRAALGGTDDVCDGSLMFAVLQCTHSAVDLQARAAVEVDELVDPGRAVAAFPGGKLAQISQGTLLSFKTR